MQLTKLVSIMRRTRQVLKLIHHIRMNCISTFICTYRLALLHNNMVRHRILLFSKMSFNNAIQLNVMLALNTYVVTLLILLTPIEIPLFKICIKFIYKFPSRVCLRYEYVRVD